MDATRRALITGLGSAAFAAALPGMATTGRLWPAQLAALEAGVGGRLGVCAIDTATGGIAGWRADERFGFCSTFKLPLAALVLHDADAGRLDLAEFVTYGEVDMTSHAPVTREFLARGGMTLGALAEATQKTSDNVAANLLLRRYGGPVGFTARLRELGDDVTRLDRYEPDLNLVPPGEARDTTTPRAMAQTLRRMLVEPWLRADSRATLFAWLRETRTGLKRLRSGLPVQWPAGDKTGTAQWQGMPNKVHDVAVFWPTTPGRNAAPVIVAAYYEAPDYFDPLRAEDEATLAAVGRIVADWVAAPAAG